MSDRDRYPPRAVMFGGASSLFPVQLADHWRCRGVDVAIVSYDRVRRGATSPGGVPIVSVGGALNPSPLVRRLLAVASSLRHRRATVDNRKPAQPMPLWTTKIGARAAAARAMRFAPSFVFGHEVYAYGPATAACAAVPRVLFPWGFDIHDFADSSPKAFEAVRRSLLAADLVVPSSTEAAEYIRARFGIATERVRSFSWGVDLAYFRRAEGARRTSILAKYGIPTTSRVVMNVRRRHSRWGAVTAVDAFARVAHTRPGVHFVSLGNSSPDTGALIDNLRRRIREGGLERRATLLIDEIELADVRDLMAVSDVFLSLPTFVDMRSASNLQAAACGAVPIISDQEEIQRMRADGFRAQLVDPSEPEQIAAAVAAYLDSPELMETTRLANASYLARNEDQETNLDRMLAAIGDVCRAR